MYYYMSLSNITMYYYMSLSNITILTSFLKLMHRFIFKYGVNPDQVYQYQGAIPIFHGIIGNF